jgi:hypothetical protein
VVSIWLLGLVVVALAISFALVPRLRQRPPRGGGPAPRGSTTTGDDGLLRDTSDRHPGPPTMGRDPDGPPAP